MKIMSSDSGLQQNLVRHRRIVLVVALITVVGAGSLAAAYSFHFFGLGRTGCGTSPSYQPSSAQFTIVMDNQGMNVGFNGSKYHSIPWPMMNVSVGQTVSIHVTNNDPTQPHGFAITRYFDRGITLRSGECYDATFVADQPGSFTVYCNIFCTIHVYMQDGRLTVS